MPADHFTILMDGWSVAALPSKTLTLSDGSTVDLRPLNEEEIEALPASELAKLTARLVSAERGWKCSESGCTSDNGTFVDLAYLTAPATIPVFGEVYAAAGVDHGVYAASLKTPSSGTLWLKVGDWLLKDGAVVDLVPGDYVTLSAGLGVIFPTTPRWAATADEFYYYEMDYGYPAVDVDGVSVIHNAFANGLSDGSAAAHLHRLDDSQLTLITSLTMGCGAEVVCTTTASQVEVHDYTEDIQTVCFDGEPLGGAVIYQRTSTITPSHPTFQMVTLLSGITEVTTLSAEQIDALLADPVINDDAFTMRSVGIQVWTDVPPAESTGDRVYPALTAYMAFSTPVKPGEPLLSTEEAVQRLLPGFATLCDWTYSEPATDDAPLNETQDGIDESTAPTE